MFLEVLMNKCFVQLFLDLCTYLLNIKFNAYCISDNMLNTGNTMIKKEYLTVIYKLVRSQTKITVLLWVSFLY